MLPYKFFFHVLAISRNPGRGFCLEPFLYPCKISAYKKMRQNLSSFPTVFSQKTEGEGIKRDVSRSQKNENVACPFFLSSTGAAENAQKT